MISFWEIRCDKNALLAHHRYHIAVSDSVNSIILERGVGWGDARDKRVFGFLEITSSSPADNSVFKLASDSSKAMS